MNAVQHFFRFLLISLKCTTEPCVKCWKDTGVPIGCDLDDPRRKGNYKQEEGQICEKCAKADKTRRVK